MHDDVIKYISTQSYQFGRNHLFWMILQYYVTSNSIIYLGSDIKEYLLLSWGEQAYICNYLLSNN